MSSDENVPHFDFDGFVLRVFIRAMRFQPLRTTLLLGLCAILATGSSFAGQTITAKAPPLPEVPKDRPIELRMLYLEDPRLPAFEAARRAELCRKLEHLLQAWFGYRATIREVGSKNLRDTFTAKTAVFRRHPAIIRMQIDPEREPDRLRAVITGALAPHSLASIESQLQAGPLRSREHAIDVAGKTFFERLRALRAIPVLDGRPFADPERPELNSYMHWCAITHEMEEADFVLTNSMLLGADAEMSLTIVVRGGVTNGNANSNRHNAFKSAFVVGLFPFLSDAPFWLRERGALPESQRLDVMATMIMHEFGHMLLRRTEYYDHPHCVHVAPHRLRYYEWHSAIREHGPCRLEHARLSTY